MRSIGVLLVFIGGFVIYLVAKGKGPDAMNALLGIQTTPKTYGGVLAPDTFDNQDGSKKPGFLEGFFKKNADGSYRFYHAPESNWT